MQSRLSGDGDQAEMEALRAENRQLREFLLDSEKSLKTYQNNVNAFEAEAREEAEDLKKEMEALRDACNRDNRRAKELQRECDRLAKAKSVIANK